MEKIPGSHIILTIAHLHAILEEYRKLSVKDEVEEFMFLGLRMNDGITAEAFKKAFSLDLLSVYGETLEI